MAFGSHWEWRGFGGVDSKFAERFNGLHRSTDIHNQSDYYIYIPGFRTNLKIRQGKESGLKFKHFGIRKGKFEQWSEYEDELFSFPLSSSGRELLISTLKSSKFIEVNSIPSTVNNCTNTLSWLREIGCQIIEVKKRREIRELHNSGTTVLVEWTCIHKPQPLTSISLESKSFEKSDKQRSSDALKQIKSAFQHLELQNLPLNPHNYLDAVSIWSKSNKI